MVQLATTITIGALLIAFFPAIAPAQEDSTPSIQLPRRPGAAPRSAEKSDEETPDEDAGPPQPPRLLDPVGNASLLLDDSPYSELDLAALLREARSRHTAELIQSIPGVWLQRVSPGWVEPTLRGFSGSRNVTVLDGFRFNHSAMRSGPNPYFGTIDSEILSSADVALGSGKVRYGTDAVGGSIVLSTLDAGPRIEGRDHTVTQSARVSTADSAITQHTEVGGRVGDFRYRLGGTYRSYGDIDAGRHVGRQDGTSYENRSSDAKISWDLSETTDFTLAWQLERQYDVPLIHRTRRGVLWRNTLAGEDARHEFDQFRDLVSARVTTVDAGLFDRVSLGVIWNNQQEIRHRTRIDPNAPDDANELRDRQFFDLNTYGLTLTLEQQTPLGDLMYGFDTYYDRVNSGRRDYALDGSFTDAIQGPVGDNSTYDLSGLFVEDSLALTDTTRFTLGGRLAYGSVEADRVFDPATGDQVKVEDIWIDYSAEARLSQEITDEVSVWLSGSRSIRMPNLSDLTRYDDSRTNLLEVPSLDLRPERFYTVELGIQRDAETWDVGASGWLTWIDSLIEARTFRDQPGPNGETVVINTNVGTGRMYGAELWTRYHLSEEWSTRATLSYAYGQVAEANPDGSTTDRSISRLPPAHGEVVLRWASSDTPTWIEGVVEWAEEQTRLSRFDREDRGRIPRGGTPGFFIYSLRAGFRPYENVDATIMLQNLTDVDYRRHGSGINEPGANLIAQLRWMF